MVKKKVFSIGTALSQGLEETIESAQHYSSELRVEVIPIKKIELDPLNPRDLLITIQDVQQGIQDFDKEKLRKQAELESLKSMAGSINAQGIINPILVYKVGEKYRLIAGERRTLASILAGKSVIQAKIVNEEPNELKISLLQWIENMERSDLTLWERITNLKIILSAYAKPRNLPLSHITIAELSNLIGCVKSHAMNYKAVLNGDPLLMQLIAENKIKNLEKAALISDIRETNIRQQAIEACVAGATLKQLKNIAEQEKVKFKPSKQIERRGRKSLAIQFGGTKNAPVAKIIIESILASKTLSHLSLPFHDINWGDPRAVSDLFKQLLKTLEKLHVERESKCLIK